MTVLLHKWEFKNIEVEFLKASEKIWSQGLPDIGARKSWDFLILTFSASTVQMHWEANDLAVKRSNRQNSKDPIYHGPRGPKSAIAI